ncbi:MAG: glycosyltransferase family 39 protein [Candidatus Moraniibacteriota bacterium]|nr:MAG: glycosyltransferase family 39 protein [Candidatus Moranbacteria bacterium]
MSSKAPFFIAIFSLIFLFVASLSVSWKESTTMDEQAHIPASYSYVKYLDMRLNPEHPPLIKIFAGIPLLFLDVTFPLHSADWETGLNAQWTIGKAFLHGNNAHLITFLSRIPILLIAILLGIFLFFWTKKLFGLWAGAGVVVLYSFNPTILAHSHYVTTDIAIATAIFISFYFFIQFLRKPNAKNIFFFGIIFGITQLVKFSAFILYPFFTFITILYVISLCNTSKTILLFFQDLKKNIIYYGTRIFIVFLISLLPIGLIYGIFTWNMPIEKIVDLTHTQLPDNGIPGFFKIIIFFLADIPLLSIFCEYLLGLAMVFVRVTGGNTHYFLGIVSNSANPAYFPVVYLLKETLPILGLLLFGTFSQLFIAIKNRSSFSLHSFLSYFRSNIEVISMGLFVSFYSYLSITGNLTIGLRHLFPILPFLYIFAIATLLFIQKTFFVQKRKSKYFLIFLTLLFSWVVLIPIIHYPSYLSYYNELIGGPKNGYLYVTDSNYDWGQDLRNLKIWIDTYNICSQMSCVQSSSMNTCPSKCKALTSSFPTPKKEIEHLYVDYFGGSDPNYWLKEKAIPWHANNAPKPGWYAISTMFLIESMYKINPSGTFDYKWLKDITPVGRAGDSIFIYYIEEKDLKK